MQYLIYPSKVMNITQNYSDSFSHKPSSTGNPKSYPIDEACEDSGRSYLYAPCDMVIKRIYGVGNSGANTIWLESKEKVKLAKGTESYVTIMFEHSNDDTLKNLKVGQVLKQKEKMFTEGNDGNVTGNHSHIEVANCKFSELKNNGWVKNSKDVWVISNNGIKPEEAFYVDKSFTTIKNSNGIKFKDLPKEEDNVKKEEYTKGDYQTLTNMNIRSGAGTNYSIKKVKDLTTDGKKNATNTNLNANAIYKKGTIFTASEIIIAKDGAIWGRSPSGYICIKDDTEIYCKKV